MEYNPTPRNIGNIELNADLLALVEELAENAHEVWAQKRISDGWSYGESRNDTDKKHPCLIPYADLPESEKEYDRNLSIQTLKLIMAMGYRIERCYE